MDDMARIGHNLAEVRQRIQAAAAQAGRNADEIRLIAVSKTHSARLIGCALASNCHDFGESRIQEAHEKITLLSAERARIQWHLIGHLQRNKAKLAAADFDLIHSVDSLRLAEALNRHVDEGSLVGQRRLGILLQINVSGEASKEGFDLSGGMANRVAFDRLLPEIEAILHLPALEVRGLMTIAPLTTDIAAARPIFARLRDLRDELAARYPSGSWHELSMGMSDDFEAAIQEGSTLVRIGRAIFGQRPAT